MSRRWRLAVRLLLGSLAILIVLAAAVAVRVRARVLASLRPPRAPVGAPTGLDAVRHVQLVTRDGVAIRGWYVPSRNRAAVILGHGWAGQRGTLLPEARLLAAHGYGVAMFDWRGHGESGGSRTTWGIDEQRDLDAVLSYVARQPDVDPSRIGALGFSMGGTVVAHAAERDPRLRAVAVEGAHASVEAEMRYDERKWGWWSGTVGMWTLRQAGIPVGREPPIKALCRISPRPFLVIGGTRDAGLPVAEAEQMYATACQPKALVIVPGATHGQYVMHGGTDFDRRLVAFFDASLLPEGSRDFLPPEECGDAARVSAPSPATALRRLTCRRHRGRRRRHARTRLAPALQS